MRGLLVAVLLLVSTVANAGEIFSGFAMPIDGGTFRLHAVSEDGREVYDQNVLVALWGVKAPAYGQSCGSRDHRWQCGREAAWALLEIVSSSEIVNCEEVARSTVGAIGTQGVVIARCVLSDGERDLAELMARRGLALAREGDRYLAAQNMAKQERLGLWRKP